MPLPVLAMKCWIVQDWRWWLLPWFDFTQHFCIGFEERVHGFNHLPGHPPHNAQLPSSFPSTFIVSTVFLDETFVEVCPLGFLSDYRGNNEEHHQGVRQKESYRSRLGY